MKRKAKKLFFVIHFQQNPRDLKNQFSWSCVDIVKFSGEAILIKLK